MDSVERDFFIGKYLLFDFVCETCDTALPGSDTWYSCVRAPRMNLRVSGLVEHRCETKFLFFFLCVLSFHGWNMARLKHAGPVTVSKKGCF